MIAIIDYGAGNIRSIAKALELVGAQVQVTDEPAVVANANAVVLPGVGSGGAAMARMTAQGLDGAIREATPPQASHYRTALKNGRFNSRTNSPARYFASTPLGCSICNL